MRVTHEVERSPPDVTGKAEHEKKVCKEYKGFHSRMSSTQSWLPDWCCSGHSVAG